MAAFRSLLVRELITSAPCLALHSSSLPSCVASGRNDVSSWPSLISVLPTSVHRVTEGASPPSCIYTTVAFSKLLPFLQAPSNQPPYIAGLMGFIYSPEHDNSCAQKVFSVSPLPVGYSPNTLTYVGWPHPTFRALTSAVSYP